MRRMQAITAAALYALAPAASAAELEDALAYVKKSWRFLVRSHADLAKAAADPKFPAPHGRWPVYVPATENLAQVRRTVEARLSAEDRRKVELRAMPAGKIAEPGLLYVPHPYVVPGGRFNEMYGWDSFFIVLGLLRDGELELARQMTDNQLYQVRHYGKVLNANRSYYLTRSHPPFLARMVLRVFERTGDRRWLAEAWPLVERQYAFFTSGDRLTPSGLSRYWDDGEGPAPEVISDEKDEKGQTHYQRVAEYFRTHTITDYDVSKLYANGELTPLFYKADRAMRESGFDPSARFGPFNAGILDYNPVCLNSLLFQMEQDAAKILEYLGRAGDAHSWTLKAALRRARVSRLMWDEEAGLFFDHDFAHGRRRKYEFATTFFPLWTGLATPAQAARVAANLKVFERPGGIVTSTKKSGTQWDAPFGWAPLQHAAVQGLRRYGYHAAADRLTVKFLSLVLKEFRLHNAMFEKYDVEERRSTVAAGLRFGYTTNEIGFGWTNAAFTDLYAELSPESRPLVRETAGGVR